MPKKDGYVCDACGSRSNSPGRLATHKQLYCAGTHDTTGTHEGTHEGDTRETPNSITEIGRDTSAGTHGTLLSTTDLPSEMKRDTCVPSCVPGPVAPVADEPDPLVEIKDAVVYLDARRDYLDRWELGFVSSVKFIVLGKTNGDRARSLTPDMVMKLFETKAKVEGLEERDKQEAEYDRVQRHFSEMRQPGHPADTCALCIKDKAETARLKAASDAYDAEMEPSRAADRARNMERRRLEAARIEEARERGVRYRAMVRKRLAAREAATPGAEKGEGSDAR